MEASALHAPTRLARLTSSPSLLRLRSDEQLVSLLRSGSPEAFRAIYERYGQRLFSYVRQMLGPGSRQDAEDVLQDVFARTYTTLRTDNREVNLRPWLYRVARNRCIDHLRRPRPATTELLETSGKALQDPFDEIERREDLQRLVADIERLPEQQKSALLLREINGLSYRELAEALDVSVPAVKSLLVRARVELVETAEARETACFSVRDELALAVDRRVRPSPRARRHLRDCAGCRDYQAGVRGMRRSLAALSPVAVAGPLAVIVKAAGFGGSSGGAGATVGSAGGGAAGGFAGGGLAAGTAGKIAAVVSTAAITAGGAVEIERRVSERAKATPAAETQGSGAEGQPSGASAPALSATGATADERKRGSGSKPASSRRPGDRPASGRRQRRAGTDRERSTDTRRADAPGAGVDRPSAGAPADGRTPAGPGGGSGGPIGGGGAAPGADVPSSTGAPVAPTVPVTAPEQTPDVPSLPEQDPAIAPAPADPPPALPAPTVEAPVAPPVKDKIKEKVGDLPKPVREVGPKPGRGPKVDPGRGSKVDPGL